jgi:hypothetical protein
LAAAAAAAALRRQRQRNGGRVAAVVTAAAVKIDPELSLKHVGPLALARLYGEFKKIFSDFLEIGNPLKKIKF